MVVWKYFLEGGLDADAFSSFFDLLMETSFGL
jgi:hypothetical protein